MREIKFRGKRLKDGKWLYGSLADYRFEIRSIEDKKKIIFDNIVGFATDNFSFVVKDCAVDPATIGQYVGLLDCNGREIYEGDMLECPNVPTISLEVYYNPAKGSFCLAEHTHTEGVLNGTTPIGEMLMHYPNMHIIGNIHDNL